ncbi:LPP20 family lipoprotein [Deferribacteraceae bacterium V6Fe1]|nr:LPP20 family lipoprotein [Deferribacteraceae bacterium V6Fe1]
MKKIFAIIVLLISFTNVMAENKEIFGIGYGQDREIAKKEALADLATQISVNIKSDFERVQKVLNNEIKSSAATSIIKTSSEIPLLGIKFEYQDDDKVIAILSSENSLSAYINEIEKLTVETNKLKTMSEQTNNSSLKYDYLLKILSNLKLLEKYKTVAIILGHSNFPVIDITESEIKDQLVKIQQTPDSLDTVVNIISKELTFNKIYIFPVKPKMSEEITEFSKLLKTMLAQKTDSVDTPENAEFLLRGNYEVINNKILLNMNLYNKNYNSIKNYSLIFDSKIINAQFQPQYQNFDYALLTGNVTRSNLKVKIGFKGYGTGEGIDLNAGDKVDLVINTNQPICYYIVGHVFNKNEKFSYLLPIGVYGDEFKGKIAGELVNTNYVVAENIEIAPPYGREVLQLFATTLGNDGKCELNIPSCHTNKDGYCVLENEPIVNVGKTRGLSFKNVSKNIETSEAIFSFTTFE